MGKWSWLKDAKDAAGAHTYPRLPEDPTYDQVVQTARDEFKDTPLQDVFVIYNRVRDHKDGLERQVSIQNVTLDALQRRMETCFESLGTESVTTLDGYRFTLSPTPYAQVRDKTALREWAEAEMAEALSLPWATTNALVKQALETGDPLPPGVEVFLKSSVSRTKR